MADLVRLAAELRDCLDAVDPDQALVAFAGQPRELDVLEPAQTPPPLVGLAAMLSAGALLRRGMPDRVAALFNELSDALAPAGRKGEGNWRMLVAFHCLYGPLIDAALALKDQAQAVRLLNQCRADMRTRGEDGSTAEPAVAALMAHPGTGDYGPFRIGPAWLLSRYEQTSALGPLDHRLAEVQTFHAGLVESALLAEAPRRAMPLIEQELHWYLASAAIDTSHFEFNAICVLAVLGRFDEALAAARQLVRRGYHLMWRFSLESARQMAWTQEMRQNEWLEALARTPDYQRFLTEDLPGPLLGDDPAINPLCMVKDGVWTGKANKRCCISRQPIRPGAPVVRFRRLFNRASDGDLEMAASEAFGGSPWQAARLQFETDAIPVALLFPRNFTRDAQLNDAPHIHAFAYDVARDPEAFDIARAVELIADHAPPPIEYTWDKGSRDNRWEPAFPRFGGADGHGDAVSLAWRAVKAGFCDAMLKQVSALPDAKADKVFAMLGTFEDLRLRGAAAAHFDLPDLPPAMAVVFKDRLSLEDHEALAAFGSRNSRYRAGLAAAMQAYGLHLYSNYRPKADWFLAGLERYAMAGGSALLYLLIDHPEDDPVLKTVVEQGWLPDKSSGSIVDYGNARPFYARTTLFHLARNQPARLDSWLTPQVAARWNDSSYGRETLRLINKHRTGKARPT